MNLGFLTACLPDWDLCVSANWACSMRAISISIEHEDRVWRGTAEKVTTGLEIAQRTLAPLFVT